MRLELKRLANCSQLELSQEHLDEYNSLKISNWQALIQVIEAECKSPRLSN